MPTKNSPRLSAALRWLAIPVVAAGLAFAWWTISPLFINTRVDEAFPTAAASALPAASAPSPAPAATSAPPASSAPPVASVVPSAPPSTSAPPAASVPYPAPVAEPVVLASGSFTRIDALHSAEGTATIYALPDGSRVLRLEPFSSQNGPDLYVSLSGHPMPRSNAETFDSGYVELERLKANQGNQNYVLPADLDLAALMGEHLRVWGRGRRSWKHRACSV